MTMRFIDRTWACAALLLPLLGTGCAVGPDYHRPALPAEAAYQSSPVETSMPGTAPQSGPVQRLVEGKDIPAQWWELFQSKTLEALVAQAIRNNPTLDAAKASLRAASETARAQMGAYYPSVEASLQPTRQRVANTLASPASSGESLFSLTTAQVTVSYTPDVFGANRRSVESLVAQEDLQRMELEAAYLTLTSNVVSAAIQDALLRAQMTTTKEIIADQRVTLEVFHRQYELGQVSQADLAVQEAAVAQVEATLPALEKQFRINRDLLAALLGRTPGESLDYEFDFTALTLPAALPVSLPARLVEQRPDVLAADAQLHAASAQVGVAVAARWPSFNISGAYGSAAVHPVDLFTGPAAFWSIAASLTQPIFSGGTLLHKQRAGEAAYDQSLAQYRSTVVGAFQNVADVLGTIQTDADALIAQEKAERAAAKSLELAKRQLALGDVSQLTFLTAQQTYRQSRLALVQAQASRYVDSVALFQALGGGWWNRPGLDAGDQKAGGEVAR